MDLGVNQKCICDFVLEINSNFGRISYHFRDIDVELKMKWLQILENNVSTYMLTVEL